MAGTFSSHYPVILQNIVGNHLQYLLDHQGKEGVGVGRIAYSIAGGMVPQSTNNHCNYQWYS